MIIIRHRKKWAYLWKILQFWKRKSNNANNSSDRDQCPTSCILQIIITMYHILNHIDIHIPIRQINFTTQILSNWTKVNIVKQNESQQIQVQIRIQHLTAQDRKGIIVRIQIITQILQQPIQEFSKYFNIIYLNNSISLKINQIHSRIN